jgi:hypothetical protein
MSQGQPYKGDAVNDLFTHHAQSSFQDGLVTWDQNVGVEKGVSLRQLRCELVIPLFLRGSRRFWLNNGRPPLKMGCFQQLRGVSGCLGHNPDRDFLLSG